MSNILGKINNQDIANPFSNNNSRNGNDAKVLYHSVLPTKYDEQVQLGSQLVQSVPETIISIEPEKNSTNNIKDDSQKVTDATIERFIDFAVELLKNRKDYVDVINKIFEKLG